MHGETSNASASTRARRSSSGSFQTGSPSQMRTSNATKRAGISADEPAHATLGGVKAHLHGVEVERAVALDDDLAVERRAGRQALPEWLQLGEVAKQRALVPAPETQLAVEVLEHAAKSVPLGLVLPALTGRELADELGLHGREGEIGRRHRAIVRAGASLYMAPSWRLAKGAAVRFRTWQ